MCASQKEERPTIELVEELENILRARATGKGAEAERYKELRSELRQNRRIYERLPRFIRTSRSLDHFWEFIKGKFGTYQERREFLHNEFAPVYEYLERRTDFPSDETVTENLERFGAEHVTELWAKALDRRTQDPTGAITVARSMLEALFKHLLDELDEDYSESASINDLYKATSKALDVHPSQWDEEVFAKILGSVHNIVDELAHFRNESSDAHGRGPYHLNPLPRHATLAINLAGTLAVFLIQTWEEREE